MKTVFDLADWFLHKERMTHKKLQKLCYYATAWSYAIQPEPICNASFEAWVHGPVCRELYNAYRSYGFGWIPQKMEYDSVFDSNEEDFLESVWDTYGDLGANSLEALSHSEIPWRSARLGLSPDEPCEIQISPEEMRKYYLSIYEGGDA